MRMRHLLAFVCFLAFVPTAFAENLTDATRKLLADGKLPESVMAGLDRELAVPASLVAAAKKDGKVRVQLQMSDREFAAVSAVFSARYPGIKVEYLRGIGAQTQKALVAYRTGTIVTDVIAAYDSRVDEFRAAGLAEVRGLPAYASLRDEMKTPEGTDGADKMNYWCTTYSTERVKAADLPKTWDDLLTSPRWRDGKLALASNAGQTFLPTLAVKLGPEWTKNFLDRLFGEVKPQLRKETLAATSKLISVGEFDLVVSVQDYVTERDAKKGVPVAARCPEPVVATWGKLGILKKTPYPNAALLYENWHMSKEGQIAAYVYARQVPVHRDLGGKEFLPYPDEVLGKKTLYRTDDVLAQQGRVIALWAKYWQQAGSR
jgi:ABC-type Fe3+ transport system substrate-binding protein